MSVSGPCPEYLRVRHLRTDCILPHSYIGATEVTEVTERDGFLTRLLIRAKVCRRRAAGVVLR